MTLRSFVLTAVAVLAAAPLAAAGQASKAALKNPAEMKETAPATYKAKFETSAGDFVVEVHRAWAPKGADRFYNLVKHGFFDDCRFFRVVPNFMVQFGINGDPAVQTNWVNNRIADDPVKESNKRGYITFATAGPNSRTTQVFINFADNTGLDRQGFAPFGTVTTGMEVVDKINAQYGAEAGAGADPVPGERVSEQGLPEAGLHQEGYDREVKWGTGKGVTG